MTLRRNAALTAVARYWTAIVLMLLPAMLAARTTHPVPQKSPPAPMSATGERHFVYQTDGKQLAEVLQDFAASQDLVAVIADGVTGVVSGKFDTTPRGFLNGIAKAYGIIWYHDGSALYFYPGKAIQTRMFRLKGFDSKAVKDLLESLHLGDKRYSIVFDKAQNTLLVSGPPRHIEIVREALDTLDQGVAENNERVTRIVPLRFASAADRGFGNTTVRGIASIMRSLYANGAPRGDAGGGEGASRRTAQGTAMQRQYGTPMKPMTGVLGDKTDSAAGRSETSTRGMESPVRLDVDHPNFEADEGINAVIVQGSALRMAEYESLIRRLDQKPQLVELEAMIIDVSADSVGSLGVDWSLASTRGSLSLTSPGSTAPTSNAVGAVSSSAYTIGTVLTNAGRELVARVQALQGEGKARIVSRPTVLGVANRSAVMKEKRVATVKVAGNLEANLFQIEAGTMLQVTPQVFVSEGGNQIKLSLYIEDGSFDSQVVDQVPVVKKTEIRTEAHVREGESLLIGGIIIDSDSNQASGVPGLRDLPVVGGLFRWSGNRNSRTERLFLITPRLVDGPSLAAAGPAARAAIQERQPLRGGNGADSNQPIVVQQEPGSANPNSPSIRTP